VEPADLVELPPDVEDASEDSVDIRANEGRLPLHRIIVRRLDRLDKMTEMAGTPVDRPLALGEVLAETSRIYRERLWAAFGLGSIVAVVFAVAGRLPDIAAVPLLAILFTVAYAAAQRLASGDGFAHVWRRLGRNVLVLAVLTLVVSIPFALGVFIRAADPLAGLVFILFAVSWLVFLGFSIPVSVDGAETGERGSRFDALATSLQRSIGLARTDFLHAVGVVAALLVIYGLVGPFMAAALVGFAENSVQVAFTLSQVVLAPFFFLGLAVLYAEQKARSARRERRGA
jgi:hypothetical protein